MRSFLAYSLVVIATGACSGSDDRRTSSEGSDNEAFWANAPVLTEDARIDSLSALDFFRALRNTKSTKGQLDFVTVGLQIPKGWVTRSEVEELIKHIRSEERAYCVISMLSSYLPADDSSTVGGQAMNLIDAYRFNWEYPPLWSCAKTDSLRVANITTWWSEGGQQEEQELNYPKK